MITNLERRAAASSADCDDDIGIAGLEDPLPVHYDLQDWNRHRGRGFDWEQLFNLAEFCDHVKFAMLANVAASRSAFVRLYQDYYQVPTIYVMDRTFVESSGEAWFASFLEL